jgi:hypothetical protein
MSVTLYEPALRALLDSEDGLVGQYTATKAVFVAAEARRNVRAYFHTAPSLYVDEDVDFAMEGSSAVIGIRDAGEKSQRMAEYQAEGSVNWLLDALSASKTVLVR